MGTTFYIILKGSVSLLIPEIPSNKKNGPESPLQSPSKITNTKVISPKSLKKKTNIVKNNMDRETIMKISTYEELGVDKSTKLKEKPQIVEPPKLKKIKTLSSGDSFGELALIENQPRAATIICDTDCYFSVLEKEYFNWILSINY